MKRSNKNKYGTLAFRQEKIRHELNQKARRQAEHRALRERESQPIGVESK
jgi:hypothetical protein